MTVSVGNLTSPVGTGKKDYNMNNVVYIIEDASGATKIGITDNIVNRMSGLQTGNSSLLTLRCLINCPSREVSQDVEKILHGHYHSYRLQGEWFRIDANTIIRDLKLVFTLFPYTHEISLTAYKKVVAPTRKLPSFQAPVTEREHPDPKVIKGHIMDVIKSHLDTKMTYREIHRCLPLYSKWDIGRTVHSLVNNGYLDRLPVSSDPKFKQYYFAIAQKEGEQ